MTAWSLLPPALSGASCGAVLQDAHVPHDTKLPDVMIATGPYNKFHSLWETLYQAIQEAQHFIYITGWSVDTEITLLRDRPLGSEGFVKVGELLKQKADEGYPAPPSSLSPCHGQDVDMHLGSWP